MNYKQIRQDAGMTISQMAEWLGINQRTVRRYEDGTRNAGGGQDTVRAFKRKTYFERCKMIDSNLKKRAEKEIMEIISPMVTIAMIGASVEKP